MNQIVNGVTFNINNDSYHTYDDFNLILENCVISPAEAKVYTIDVPGRNGKLDVTASITRSLVYQNRTITLTLRLKRNSNASNASRFALRPKRDALLARGKAPSTPISYLASFIISSIFV